MGPRGVVVCDPGRNQIANAGQIAEQRLVQNLVPHPAVEAFDKAVLHWFARRDVVPLTLCSEQDFKTAFDVNSVPLLEAIMPSFPRRSISAVSSQSQAAPRD